MSGDVKRLVGAKTRGITHGDSTDGAPSLSSFPSSSSSLSSSVPHRKKNALGPESPLAYHYLERRFKMCESAVTAENIALRQTYPQLVNGQAIALPYWRDGRSRIVLRNMRIGRPHEFDDATKKVTLSSLSRTRNSRDSYTMNFYVDVALETKQIADPSIPPSISWVKQHSKPMQLCSMSTMLRSDACNVNLSMAENIHNREHAGSFVINGDTKYIPPLSGQCHNQWIIKPDSKSPGGWELQIRSIHHSKRAHSTLTTYGHYSGLGLGKSSSSSTSSKKSTRTSVAGDEAQTKQQHKKLTQPHRNRGLTFDIQYLDEPIPLSVLFLMLECGEIPNLFAAVRAAAQTKDQWQPVFENLLDEMLSNCPVQTSTEALLWFYERTIAQKQREQKQMARAAAAAMATPVITSTTTTTIVPTPIVPRILTEEEKLASARAKLAIELWPHIGNASTNQEKLMELGSLLLNLFRVSTVDPRTRKPYMKPEARDHLSMKRFEEAAPLRAGMFRQVLSGRITQVKPQMMKCDKDDDPVAVFIKHFDVKGMTRGLMSPMKTGKWISNNRSSAGNKARPGTVQSFNCQNIAGTDSYRMRLSNSLMNTPNVVDARKYNLSYCQYIDPSQTPESKHCGLVQYRAMGEITTGSDPTAITSLIEECGSEFGFVPRSEWLRACEAHVAKCGGENPALLAQRLKEEGPHVLKLSTFNTFDNVMRIKVDGIPIGGVRNVAAFEAWFVRLRAARNIDRFASIYPNRSQNFIDIQCDAGRLSRPLVVAARRPELLIIEAAQLEAHERWKALPKHQRSQTFGAQIFDFQRLLTQGFIEYVDANEEQKLVVAKDDPNAKEHERFGKVVTHYEIHTSLGLSIMTGQGVYGNHNPSPRNTYQGSMKQQCATQHDNSLLRYRPTRNTLMYAQRPMVTTMMTRARGPEYELMGVNAEVVMTSYKGWGIEDGIIVRRGFLEKGAMATTYTKTHFVKHDNMGASGTRSILGRPHPSWCVGMKSVDYSRVQENGLATKGTWVPHGAPFLARTTGLRGLSATGTDKVQLRRDDSLLNHGDSGLVMDVRTDRQADGITTTTTVRIVSTRDRIKGDKLATQHGQKGVITKIVDDEDMLFDPVTGVPVDIIVIGNSIISRMTIGQMRESRHTTARALDPDRVTAFATPQCDRTELDAVIESVLLDAGMTTNGKRRLASGETGKMIDCPLTVGFLNVQVLKHQARDKEHTRSDGPRHPRTKQPLEGMNRGGGVRVGGMEVSVTHASGAAIVLHEKTVTMSDATLFPVCQGCYQQASISWKDGVAECNVCKTGAKVGALPTAQATGRLYQDAMVMGVQMYLETEATGETVSAETKSHYKVC